MKGFSVFLFAALLASLLCVGASAGGGDISPALDVLRGELTMNKCGIAGDNIKFSEEDFQSLYGSTVNFITVTSLPDESEGSCRLTAFRSSKDRPYPPHRFPILNSYPHPKR